jgi:hypothetical protein
MCFSASPAKLPIPDPSNRPSAPYSILSVRTSDNADRCPEPIPKGSERNEHRANLLILVVQLGGNRR